MHIISEEKEHVNESYIQIKLNGVDVLTTLHDKREENEHVNEKNVYK